MAQDRGRLKVKIKEHEQTYCDPYCYGDAFSSL